MLKCTKLNIHTQDHDAAVNLPNWGYFSGTGTDPRDRRFKTVTQGMQYDADAQLAATWLPELVSLPPVYRHMPWSMPAETAAQCGFVSGLSYPEPMVPADSQIGKVPAGGAKQQGRQKPKGT